MDMLRRGDSGSAVNHLQEALRGLGAAIADPPGRFGLWTEAAVYLLQRSAGVAADGIVGPQTQEALRQPAPAGFAARAAAPLTLIEGVPYRSQRDNAHSPNSSCNVTALAMALLARGAQARRPGAQLEDELFELLRSPEADAYYRGASPALHARGVAANEVHDNLVWAAGRYGVAASFSGHRTMEELAAEVSAGRPVLLSGVFVGSGHIVLLIGLTVDGDFIVHDPFGDWNTGYQSHDGAARIYGRDRALAVLKDLGAPDKWGLFLRA